MRRLRAEQLAGPAQLRFQPRNQLLQRERLHQIVVGAAAQAMHAVMQAAARGQNQHRNRVVALSDLAQQLEPVAVRQSEVENEGGIERRREHGARFLDGRQDVGLVARRFQSLRQQLGELFIVFDDQQSHSGSPDRHDDSARLAHDRLRRIGPIESSKIGTAVPCVQLRKAGVSFDDLSAQGGARSRHLTRLKAGFLRVTERRRRASGRPEIAARQHLKLDCTALLRLSEITNMTGQVELGPQRNTRVSAGRR